MDTVAKSVSFNGGFVETFTDIEIFLMGSGNDTLMGSGVEFFDGGDGTDTIDYSSVLNSITVDLRNNTAEFIGNIIESFDNVERYILGSNDDLFIGGDANDYVEGGDGEDALNGFGGNDTLIGGADSDDYQVNDVGDMVIEMAGGGTEDSHRLR